MSDSATTSTGLLERALAGDLLFVCTPGAGYRLGRRLSGSAHDHMAVVVGERMTLNIVNPLGKLVPLARFDEARRAPLLLRPAFESERQRERFVERMERYDRVPYDRARTFAGVLRVAARHWLGVGVATRPLAEGAARWICTEAILLELTAAMPSFRGALELELDYTRLGFATTNDYLRIAKQRPELLREV